MKRIPKPQGLTGWIVAWPNRPDDDERQKHLCGHGLIIGQYDHYLLVGVHDRHEGEPPYTIIMSLEETDLTYFPTHEDYAVWIDYWRSQPEGLPPPPKFSIVH